MSSAGGFGFVPNVYGVSSAVARQFKLLRHEQLHVVDFHAVNGTVYLGHAGTQCKYMVQVHALSALVGFEFIGFYQALSRHIDEKMADQGAQNKPRSRPEREPDHVADKNTGYAHKYFALVFQY